MLPGKPQKAIGGALFDTLLKPFVDAFNWLFSSWLPHSPESPIGSLIVKGIAAIGGTLFDVLTDPFRRGFAWILDKLPGMGKFAEKIRGGIGGMLAEPLENKATSAYVPALQVTPEETKFTVPPILHLIFFMVELGVAAPVEIKDAVGSFNENA